MKKLLPRLGPDPNIIEFRQFTCLFKLNYKSQNAYSYKVESQSQLSLVIYILRYILIFGGGYMNFHMDIDRWSLICPRMSM